MRRLLLVLLLALPLLGAYGNGYTYRRTLTIDNANVGADLTDFPVLFSGTYSYLAHTDHSGKVTDEGGDDIAFSADSAGASLVYPEIESYNHETGAIVAWVKVALDTDADTVLYLWYGNSAVTTSQYSAGAAWNSAFKGVWHLQESYSTGADNYKDFTTNVNHATLTDADADTAAATGKVGSCVNLNGDADYLTSKANAVNPGSSNLTLSAWVKPDNFDTAYKTVASQLDGTGTGRSWMFANTTTGVFVSNLGNTTSYDTEALTAAAWNYVVVTLNGTTLKGYLAGVEAWSTTRTAESATGVHNFGASKIGAASVDGCLDEIRLSNSDRGASWIAAEYANQNSPATFYALGDEMSNRVVLVQ